MPGARLFALGIDDEGEHVLGEVAAAVREGRVSPVELVEEALRRIDLANPKLNAVVALRAEEALDDARAHPRTGALAGLPLLVKDMARCRGMRTTFGSPWFVDAPPDTVDDVVVARLREAGAIVLGRTNTPQFGALAVTTNPVFGATRNPWNVERSPGGSSGGSAAALAAGLAPLATTSDGGGSVRIPASACGLVGYKPTTGAIGRNVIPRWMSFSTMGVTGATVADVVLEASVTLGPVPGDILALPAGSVSPEPVRPVRVLACPSFRPGVDPVIAAAFDDTCAALAAAGLPVEAVAAPFGVDTAMQWFVVSAVDLATSLLDRRDRWDELEPAVRIQVDFGMAVSLADYVAAQRARFEVAARLDALLGDDAVLVVPTVNATSWTAEGPLPTSAGGVEHPAIAVNTPELNLTMHPAVSVPMGHDNAGVPFGVQVVAPRARDGLALGVAAVLEQVRPWPLTAPGYEPFDRLLG